MRLHDLKKHWFILNQLMIVGQGYKIVDEKAKLPDGIVERINSVRKRVDEGEITAEQGLKEVAELEDLKLFTADSYLKWRRIDIQSTGTNFKKYVNTLKIPSSSYELNYYYDPDKDFIHFEFSIPKFLYGHNVLQFVPHVTDTEFGVTWCKEWQWQREHVWERLQRFIYSFWRKQFSCDVRDDHRIIWKLDWRKLEIRRIDLCWNEVFNTKEDALEKLNAQKKIKWKYARETSDYKSDWATTVFYRTKMYSAKIYHKGTEFYKNDSKELKKLNVKRKKNGQPEFNIEEIQQLADRTLRYEMTFRNSYMSYLYQRTLFRRRCPEMIRLKKAAKRGRRNERIFFSGKKEDQEKVLHWRATNQIERRRDDMKQWKLWNEIVDKRRRFYVELDQVWIDYNQKTHAYRRTGDELTIEKQVKFGKNLFGLMVDKFEKFIEHFEVKEASSMSHLIVAVRQENKNATEWNKINRPLIKEGIVKSRSLINVNGVHRLVEMLEKYTWEDLKQMNFYNRSTMYRLRKKLEPLGFNPNALSIGRIPSDWFITDRRDERNERIRENGYQWYYAAVLYSNSFQTQQTYV